MWKKEILLFLIISLYFVFLVHGDFGGHLLGGMHLQKQMDLEGIEGIVKTTKIENGRDVICVDVYKQPAFKNPLLKNHKLQWQPTTFPNNFNDEILFNGRYIANSTLLNVCPPNSVPILKSPQKMPNYSTPSNEDNTLLYRFARLELTRYPDDMFYGASSFIKLNDPSCENGQNSGVSMWIASDNSDKKNVIKAGWMVYPEIYGDTEAYLSIYWTSDGFHHTGCYDHLCSGFVQLHSGYILGSSKGSYSAHGSETLYLVAIIIFQDISTKHWWLIISNNEEPSKYSIIGYWPKEIFTRFDEGATVLNYGGSTMAHAGQLFPPMGDGYFPNGRYSDSNYIDYIQYVNKSNFIVGPRAFSGKIHTDNPNCYGLIYNENEGDEHGHNLFLGGPGGQC